jgi:hypothetical protein
MQINAGGQYSTYPMQSLKGKPYVELGTGLDNIFRYFILDLVWRLSPESGTTSNVNYQKTADRFGIFGSFHIQF